MLGGGLAASAFPEPLRSSVLRGTQPGLTSGFGMGPGVSPAAMAARPQPARVNLIYKLKGHS